MTSPLQRALHQPSPQPRDLAIDPPELGPHVTSPADLRQQLGRWALAGIVTLTYRGGDLVCGVPEWRGSLVVTWIRLFGCGHVSRWCVYRSDCEALSCSVCVEAGVSRTNAQELLTRLAHVGSLAQVDGGAARGNVHQGAR